MLHILDQQMCPIPNADGWCHEKMTLAFVHLIVCCIRCGDRTSLQRNYGHLSCEGQALVLSRCPKHSIHESQGTPPMGRLRGEGCAAERVDTCVSV